MKAQMNKISMDVVVTDDKPVFIDRKSTSETQIKTEAFSINFIRRS